jgi:hypothetical protein
VWLGLTHLLTLRGVDLGIVSAVAIAAALPRLHTLAAFISASDDPPVTHTAVVGFFDILVPRLHVLEYRGPWPADNQAPMVIVPRPLPLLQELIFCCFSDFPVARGFMGARPAMLQINLAAVADMLLAAPLMTGEVTHQPLARVRDLCVTVGDGGALDPSDVALLLRAAPQLRKFNAGRLRGRLEWAGDPAFTGLVHPLLRSVRVIVATKADAPPVDCTMELRRLFFPRLQQVVIYSF